LPVMTPDGTEKLTVADGFLCHEKELA
jgi:hypothetical protein